METTKATESIIETLKNQISGPVHIPGDAGFDEARSIWNGMFDKSPAVIARCKGAADVITAVNIARENKMLLSIKGGGHNVGGKAVCEGGLMIDLSLMKSVRVDHGKKTARAEPGVTMAELDHETQAFGLATTGGFVSTTGIAGLTLGGGVGYLARKHGLTIDNLLAADVVTAKGELLHTSAEENPDLFWGIRGGGGNFGIVTSFEYKLHKVGPKVLAAQIFHPIDDAESLLHFYRDFMADAPNELACYVMAVNVPPVDPFPEDYQGKTAMAFVACYSGEVKQGEEVLKPLQNFGDPFMNVVQPMPYTFLQKSFDAGAPKGQRYYWKSHYLDGLNDEAIHIIAKNAKLLSGEFSVLGIEPMGGAICDVENNETAYPHRNAKFMLGIWSGWSDPGKDNFISEWVRKFYDSMEPHATGGMYVNYLDKDDENRIKSAYGTNYKRLSKIKKKYDPNNLFQMNTNIKPQA